MTRPLRIEYPGAFYHVTSRGNQKKNIFLSDDDRILFLKVLAKVIKKHHWRCLAYCLMNNHYHLLIETVHGDLSAGMRDLNGIYTQFFNVNHAQTGHILQGRFHAFLVEEETYLFAVARYIVLNPVRAKIVTFPGEYLWSSYRVTVGIEKQQAFLHTEDILKHLGKSRSTAQKAYIKFVLDGIGEESPLKEAGRGRVLGSPQFIHEVWQRKEDTFQETSEIAKDETMLGRPRLEDLFDDEMTKDERNKAIIIAVNYCRYSNTAVAKYLRLSQSNISLIANKKIKTHNSRPGTFTKKTGR